MTTSSDAVQCPKCKGSCLPARQDGRDPRPFCFVCRRFAAPAPKRERKRVSSAQSVTDDRTDLEAAWDRWWGIFADPSLPCGIKNQFEEGRKFEIDRAFILPHVLLAVELEGKDHQKPWTYHKDIEKYNLLAERGWRLLRYTTRCLADDPEGCVRQVERILKNS